MSVMLTPEELEDVMRSPVIRVGTDAWLVPAAGGVVTMNQWGAVTHLVTPAGFELEDGVDREAGAGRLVPPAPRPGKEPAWKDDPFHVRRVRAATYPSRVEPTGGGEFTITIGHAKVLVLPLRNGMCNVWHGRVGEGKDLSYDHLIVLVEHLHAQAALELVASRDATLGAMLEVVRSGIARLLPEPRRGGSRPTPGESLAALAGCISRRVLSVDSIGHAAVQTRLRLHEFLAEHRPKIAGLRGCILANAGGYCHPIDGELPCDARREPCEHMPTTSNRSFPAGWRRHVERRRTRIAQVGAVYVPPAGYELGTLVLDAGEVTVIDETMAIASDLIPLVGTEPALALYLAVTGPLRGLIADGAFDLHAALHELVEEVRTAVPFEARDDESERWEPETPQALLATAQQLVHEFVSAREA